MMGLVNILSGILLHPLNQKNKIHAVMNFFKWQIGTRLLPGPVAAEFANGAKLLVSRGMTGATGNIYSGLHEFEDMGFLLHFLRPEDLFVDIGANVGSYTVLSSSSIGARTIAFEPIPGTFGWLQKNVYINGAHKRVEICNLGVGSKPGKLFFTCDQDTTNHVVETGQLNSSAAQIEVDVVGLDDFLNKRSPSLIKIDVEGFEHEVLAGGKQTFSSTDTNAVIMEINGSGLRYGCSDETLLSVMKAFGFETYSYDPFTRKLLSLDGKVSQQGNTLFIKDLDLVRSRVLEADPFTVHGQTI